MSAEQKKKWFIKAIFFLVLFFLPIVSRCYIESYVALAHARAALAQSEYRQASIFYVKAARWRAPGNIFAQQAITELKELISSEAKEDKIFALSELRRALFASRSFYFPSSQQAFDIQEIDQQLKTLGARVDNPVVVVEPLDVSYSGQLLAQLGFWGWIACLLMLIWHGFDAQGTLNVRFIGLYGLAAGLFFILWLFALMIA